MSAFGVFRWRAERNKCERHSARTHTKPDPMKTTLLIFPTKLKMHCALVFRSFLEELKKKGKRESEVKLALKFKISSGFISG